MEKAWKSEPEKVVKVVQVFSTLLIYFSKRNVQYRNIVQLKRNAFDNNLIVQKFIYLIPHSWQNPQICGFSELILGNLFCLGHAAVTDATGYAQGS